MSTSAEIHWVFPHLLGLRLRWSGSAEAGPVTRSSAEREPLAGHHDFIEIKWGIDQLKYVEIVAIYGDLWWFMVICGVQMIYGDFQSVNILKTNRLEISQTRLL